MTTCENRPRGSRVGGAGCLACQVEHVTGLCVSHIFAIVRFMCLGVRLLSSYRLKLDLAAPCSGSRWADALQDADAEWGEHIATCDRFTTRSPGVTSHHRSGVWVTERHLAEVTTPPSSFSRSILPEQQAYHFTLTLICSLFLKLNKWNNKKILYIAFIE